MAKATIKFVAVSGIHNTFLDKKFENVEIVSNTEGAIVFQIPNEEDIFLNPNFKIKFHRTGIEMEGYFLVGNCLGMASVLIINYV